MWLLLLWLLLPLLSFFLSFFFFFLFVFFVLFFIVVVLLVVVKALLVVVVVVVVTVEVVVVSALICLFCCFLSLDRPMTNKSNDALLPPQLALDMSIESDYHHLSTGDARVGSPAREEQVFAFWLHQQGRQDRPRNLPKLSTINHSVAIRHEEQ